MGEQALAGGADTGVEHERLQREFAALSDQFAAANEVLSAVGRWAGDPERVLGTIVESARRLCGSDAAHLYLLQGGAYRLIKAVGLTDESVRYITDHPMPLDRLTLIGRVGLDRVTQQIADVLASSEKLGAASRFRVLPLHDVAGVITDAKATDRAVQDLEAAGVRVLGAT